MKTQKLGNFGNKTQSPRKTTHGVKVANPSQPPMGGTAPRGTGGLTYPIVGRPAPIGTGNGKTDGQQIIMPGMGSHVIKKKPAACIDS